MAGYQSQHPTGFMATIRNILGSFGGHARRNFGQYTPANIRQGMQTNPVSTGARTGMALLNPVGTAANEAARSGYQALRDGLDTNAYNSYMNDLFTSDPGYTPGGSSREEDSGAPASGHQTSNWVPQLGTYQAPPPPMYSGQTGAASTLAGAGRGQTVGYMTMNQLSEMLNAGVGQSNRGAQMTPGREMSEMRDARRAEGAGGRPAGMSVRDYIMQ